MKLLTKTIGQCLSERANETPGLWGLGYRDYRYTWKEIDEISDYVALECLEHGIKYKTHVAIWSINSPNWVFTFFALVKLGAVPVLINTCYKEKELETALREADVEYLFYGKGCKTEKYEELLEKISIGKLPKFKKKLPIEKSCDCMWYMRSDYPPMMKEDRIISLEAAKNKVKTEDTACILFTSGTTSLSKGVMLSHKSLVNNSCEIARQMRWNKLDIACIAVPLFHCFGITAGILAAIHCAAEIHLLKYYKTIEVLEQVQRYKCTILNGVPTMFLAICKNEKFSEYDFSSVKSGIIAGSPILPKDYLHICSTLGIDKLQCSFGQTESSPCIAISRYEDSVKIKAETAGRKIPGIELKIWNYDENRECKAGEAGEIKTKGYHVMQGYYNRQEETRAVIDGEGWLNTGDIGYVDEMDYLHVTGRKKEMIIRGGENISPLELEICISEFPEIEKVKAIGIPAEVLQEEIAVCIVLKNGVSLDADKIKCFIKEKLSYYKTPKYVLMFKEFPMNASGKVMLDELKKQACKLIEETEGKEEQ